MPVRLLSRQKQIPNGFRFRQNEINWSAPKGASLDVIVRSLIAARAANPAQLRKHNWSLDYNLVMNEVDEYNARLCQIHGWDNYISQPQVPTVPKPSPPDQARRLKSLGAAAAAAKSLVAGARSLMEWDESGEPAVPAELSEHRAVICTTCPLNEPGDFTKWFTVPAAEIIKRRIEKAQARKLTTPRDEHLHLCTACHCPLKVKVHVPIGWITKRIEPEQMAKLRRAPNCWIPAEADRQ